MLDITISSPSKFRTKNWVEINDEGCGTYNRYNRNNQIKYNTTMLKSNLYDHCDAYILVKGTVSVDGRGTAINDKQVIFENSYPFTDCISRSLSKKVVEVCF